MSVQMIELEEVMMFEVTDDYLEGSVGMLGTSDGSTFCTGNAGVSVCSNVMC